MFGLYRLNNKDFLDFDLFWTVLFGVQFYSGFSFIQGSVLFGVQFYLGFSFIQGSVLFRVQFYSRFSFIQGSVKTGFTV